MTDPRTILGIPFTTRSREDVIALVRDWLRENRVFHFITTPNPEFLVRAAFDSSFRRLLRQSDLRLPDGVGLVIVARLLWGIRLRRFTGVDFLLELCRLAAEEEKTVYFLGGQPGVAARAGESLTSLYAGLRIVGAESGDGPDSPGSADDLNARLRAAAPDILAVAFGAPKQERWIAAHRDRLPSLCIAVGVGGALDYVSGSVPRAPRAWRKLGLEWLYRLGVQPWRLGRIVVAVIVFPVLAILDRLRQLLAVLRIRYTADHE